MNSENAVEVRNMSKSFKVEYDKAKTLKEFIVRKHGQSKKHTVLKNINLNIKKGETVGLIGTNGSGKSTLLKLMTKIIFPTSGTVQTDGKLTSLLELGAGFHPDFTGRENIYFNASIFGLTEKEINNRIDEIISFSELGNAIDEPIRTYSSGMYMRLAFSIAINVDADILLIDEILAVGDQYFQDKCYAKLDELKKSDKTIVFVSHSLDSVRQLCDRVIWIYDGEIREDGDPVFVIGSYLNQLKEEHNLQKNEDIKNGIRKNTGIINIDLPKDFSHISDSKSHLLIGGWKISDCESEKLVLKIGNEIVPNIDYVERKDIYDFYYDEFKDTIKKETVGWQTLVDMSDYSSQIHDGYFEISVQMLNEKESVVTSKTILVYVDDLN